MGAEVTSTSQPVRPAARARSPPQQQTAAEVGVSGKYHRQRGQAEQVSGRTRWQGGHGLNPEQALSQRTLAASASFMEACTSLKRL